MKKRTDGFLAPDKIDQDGEVFDYIRELHAYLWQFVRCVLPFAKGSLQNHLDIALEKAEKENMNDMQEHGKIQILKNTCFHKFVYSHQEKTADFSTTNCYTGKIDVVICEKCGMILRYKTF